MMKYLIVILLNLLISEISIAQSKKFNSFYDFVVPCINLDSLETATKYTSKKSLNYVNNLIWMEMTYRDRNYKFGNRLDEISNICHKVNYPLGVAMLNYMKYAHLIEVDRYKAYIAIKDAHEYFKKSNDVSGLLRTYYFMARINVDTDAFMMGDKRAYLKNANLMFSLDKNINNTFDKIYLDLRRLQMSKNLGRNVDISYYENLIKRYRNGDSNYNLLIGSIIWEVGRYYFGQNNLKLTEYYYLKAIDYQKGFIDEFSFRGMYYSMAMFYFKRDKFDLAELYILKLNDSYKLRPEVNDAPRVWGYKVFSDILYHKKEYSKSWNIREIYDSLLVRRDMALALEKLVALQKEFEIQKKEEELKVIGLQNQLNKSRNAEYVATIKKNRLQQKELKNESEKQRLSLQNMTYKNQLNESKIRGYITALLITLFSVFLFLFMFIRIRIINSKLVKLSESRNMLDKIIVHDLRTPLLGYQRYSEIANYLISTKQFDRLNDALKRIDNLGLQFSLLLDNLLNWSISGKNNLKPYFSNFSSTNFIEDIVVLYKEIAYLKEIKFEINIDNFEIYSDKNFLSIIFRNLIDNSIKHSKEKGTVNISFEDCHDKYLFKVKNTFDTLDKSKIQSIGRFFKDGTDSIQKNQKLNGLGFYIVKKYSSILNCSVSCYLEEEENFIMAVTIFK